jgi:hypothetical protein
MQLLCICSFLQFDVVPKQGEKEVSNRPLFEAWGLYFAKAKRI